MYSNSTYVLREENLTDKQNNWVIKDVWNTVNLMRVSIELRDILREK